MTHVCMRAEGRGSLVDAHTVEIFKADGTSQRLTAKNILIAVGGYAYRVPIEGAVSVGPRGSRVCVDGKGWRGPWKRRGTCRSNSG